MKSTYPLPPFIIAVVLNTRVRGLERAGKCSLLKEDYIIAVHMNA